jgi:hypothetical protein
VPVDNTTTADNSTNSTSLPSGSGSASNETTNTTSLEFFNSENYTLPSGCSYVDDSETAVACASGQNSVQFTFAEINEFWDFTLDTTCTDAQT